MGIEGIQTNMSPGLVYQATGTQKKVFTGNEPKADKSAPPREEAAASLETVGVSTQAGKDEIPARVNVRPQSGKAESGRVQEEGSEQVRRAQSKPERDTKEDQTIAERKAEEDKNAIDYVGTSAKFSYNKDINRIIITIAESGNGKVLKEIPTKDTQKMLSGIRKMTGMVMDQEI